MYNVAFRIKECTMQMFHIAMSNSHEFNNLNEELLENFACQSCGIK